MIYNDIQKLESSKKNISELCENIGQKIESLDKLLIDMENIWKDNVYKKNYENFQEIYGKLDGTKEKMSHLPDYIDVVINKGTEYLDLQYNDLGNEIGEFDFNDKEEFYVETEEEEDSLVNNALQNDKIISDFSMITSNWKDCLKNKIIEENVVEILSHNDYIIKSYYKELVVFLKGFKNVIKDL